jgi:GMP synthase-like glutamine amidotransferase
MAPPRKTEILVLQHTESEYLGLLEDHFEQRAIRFTYLRPFVPGGKVPTTDAGADALILLGAGPRGVSSGAILPTLAAELRLTRLFLGAGKAVIGFGQGAAILALAAGGGVEDSPYRAELSFLSRSRDDALGGHFPERMPLFRCARDFPLPPATADILARDEQGRPAVFALGNSLGFSGHPGAKRGMIEDLIMEFPDLPENFDQGFADLIAHQRAIAESLSTLAVGLCLACGLMGEEERPNEGD